VKQLTSSQFLGTFELIQHSMIQPKKSKATSVFLPATIVGNLGV